MFDRMAERYDELRPDNDAWWQQLEVTGSAGLAGATRLLDVGCGTGRLAIAAAERYGVRAWGVDSSKAMIDRARSQGARRVAFRVATADALPFRGGWFDAVVMRLVVHTLGAARDGAFHEAARVSAPRGRLYIWTFAPDPLHGLLPRAVPAEPAGRGSRAVPGSRRARRPSCARRGSPTSPSRPSSRTVGSAGPRRRYVSAAGYISTVHLLPPDEVASAAARLEAEARAGEPDLVTRLDWRLIVGTHAA